jgi:primosomal protein N'
MPEFNFNRWQEINGNELIAEQLAYDPDQQQCLANEHVHQLNEGQHHAFTAVVQAVLENSPKLFFLNGPGGTGKTFCYKTLCYHLRAAGKIVLCVASSGIASLLLIGG